MENQYKTYLIELKSNIQDSEVFEIIRAVLNALDIEDQEIVELVQLQSISMNIYLKSQSKALKVQKKLKKMKLKNIKINLKSVQKKDWQDEWKKSFKAFSITKKIHVIPMWEKKSYVSKQGNNIIPIFIDTSLAFGTGLHETTQFMISLIEKYSHRFQNFLDIGTGTGILSITALKLGAKHIECLDICSEAIKIAKLNISENGYSNISPILSDLKNFKTKSKFDFVAANLNTLDLINMKKRIVSLVKAGKYLAISGVSLEHLDELKKEFRTLPLKCLKIYKGQQWAALVFRKKDC